jgi:hypothetical protein
LRFSIISGITSTESWTPWDGKSHIISAFMIWIGALITRLEDWSKQNTRVRGMTQVEEHLPSKHKALSLIPSTSKKMTCPFHYVRSQQEVSML